MSVAESLAVSPAISRQRESWPPRRSWLGARQPCHPDGSIGGRREESGIAGVELINGSAVVRQHGTSCLHGVVPDKREREVHVLIGDAASASSTDRPFATGPRHPAPARRYASHFPCNWPPFASAGKRKCPQPIVTGIVRTRHKVRRLNRFRCWVPRMKYLARRSRCSRDADVPASVFSRPLSVRVQARLARACLPRLRKELEFRDAYL